MGLTSLSIALMNPSEMLQVVKLPGTEVRVSVFLALGISSHTFPLPSPAAAQSRAGFTFGATPGICAQGKCVNQQQSLVLTIPVVLITQDPFPEQPKAHQSHATTPNRISCILPV